jgi:hypothetical protein
VRLGAALAVLGTAHSIYNIRRLRVPPAEPPPASERVALLLPVRNEALRLEPCLRSVLAQRNVPQLEIVVLDDESSDNTVEVVRRIVAADPRVRLVSGASGPRPAWGKPRACQQLADEVFSSAQPPTVLVFVDADVVLAKHAVASALALLRRAGLDLVSPYPRQLAVTPAERLVQPLLQWSWLTTLPLVLAERSPRPSLTAANGQFLVVDSSTYARAGGHAGVKDEVLEDIALLRAIKNSGGKGVVVDGTQLATCRMYDGWPALRDGYAKSLWSAFGSPVGAGIVVTLLGIAYVLPPLAALGGSRAGLLGYAAAVTGRVVVARRVGARLLPDVLAHPLSIAIFAWLNALSWVRHRRSRLLRPA